MPAWQTAISITDPSRIGEARRTAAMLADQAGLESADAGRAALVATELATNLGRHAREGELLLRSVAGARGLGVEILSIDRGPGMADVERFMADGYSTANSPGTGLGAVRRSACQFDIHSAQPGGTVLVARVFAARGAGAADCRVDWGVVCIPMRGEPVCGDTWCLVDTDARTAFLVADGLGHGVLAAEAAGRAAAAFLDAGALPPGQVLERAHEQCRGSRGAAVAVGSLQAGGESLRYAGVGNVSTRLVAGDRSHSLVSLNGTVGLHMPKPREFDSPWPADALLVTHSDGLNTRWQLQDPTLRARDPAVIAGALYRDHQRGSDDVTVLVGRMRRPRRLEGVGSGGR